METKECSKCGSDMHVVSPGMTTLANEFNKYAPPRKKWKCSKCDHEEEYD